MASVMAGIGVGPQPESHGVRFTARPALRTRESIVHRTTTPASFPSRLSSFGGGEYVPRPNLSTIEIEALMKEKVCGKYDSLKQAFQTYDVDHNETVTKGEFRRVLETFCFPMTTDQFCTIANKVEKTKSGSVKYMDFLHKFYSSGNSNHLRPVMSGPPAPKEGNTDMIEKLLRDKISQNLKSVVRGMQLFDYNMDGKIQRHELRRVLENYCFKFTDTQFDKLWLRHDFHHTGLVNYRDFLQRLGISVKLQGKPPSNDVPGVLKWPRIVIQQQQQSPTNRFASTCIKDQQRQDEAMLQILNFDQIEIEFRKRMRDNYTKLKRAFMAFDKRLDGFVSIEDLKAILSNFTIPMSDQLFGQLMARCGVRGSVRVAWELFLEKFQNPVSAGNGQTLPIQPNHKFNPIMDTQQAVDWEAVWKHLNQHVQNGYSSLKNAFLQFDKNRDGKVTRKDFRQIVERFTFHLEDGQFKELMNRLGVQNSSRVSYHAFLHLFEQKESLKEGHKWLKSVHKFNDKPKPAIMSHETIEDLLQEKITQYWKPFADHLAYYDYTSTGYISIPQLKRIIDQHVFTISDDHLAKLLERCEDKQDGKVNYMEFLARLNVDVYPGDLIGISSQIMDGSSHAALCRQNDQAVRQSLMDQSTALRAGMMSADEVVIRFKDKLSQLTPGIRKAFLSMDKSGKGRITKRQFREILASLGIIMTDEQFEELMSRLHLHNGHMHYMDFVLNFEDSQSSGESQLIRKGNHRVNPVRGDQFGMTAKEVEGKLRAKLQENFATLRGAFYKFDDHHIGSLTKRNFRRMLDSFMFFMSDEEYEKLCSHMGITKDTRISYIDFLDCFEVRDNADGHKWLNSVHRFNDTFPPKPLTAEEAHKVLREKAYRQWSDLAKAFCKIDSHGKGIISKKGLRDLLYKFIMPMNDDEFKRLWSRYDPESKGFISHEDFLRNLGAQEYAPGDVLGPSQRIIDGSRNFLQLHTDLQQMRHEDITQNQANLTSNMSAVEVLGKLRDKVRDNYSGLYKAFRKYDTENRGSLSVANIQKVLLEQNFYLTDEEFFLLLDKIGMRTEKTRLNYEQFLHAFEEGRKSSYGQRPQAVHIEQYPELSPEEAEKKLRVKIEKNIDDIIRTLTAIDKNQSGKVKMEELRRVIDIFCFTLTSDQWHHIKAGLRIDPENYVDYSIFLGNLAASENARYERTLLALQDLSPPPVIQATDEVIEKINEAVRAHFHNIYHDFKEADFASIGSVTREDFREVLNKHVMRVNDEQFDKVWEAAPVNEFGNLQYHDFLAKYASDDQAATLKATTVNSNLIRPYTSLSQRPESRMSMPRPTSQMARPASRSISRCSTPMVNAEPAERLLKDVIFRHWKVMQHQCRNLDTDNTGTISVSDFSDLLEQYGLQLKPEDFDSIVTKYDLRENGRFCYGEFIRHFMLHMRLKEGSVAAKRKLMPLKIPRQIKEEQIEETDFMTRVQECVSQNWKEMRREFKISDPSVLGVIPELEFRRILRQYSINLSEDEFEQLVCKYDLKADGQIAYNNFIKHFISL